MSPKLEKLDVLLKKIESLAHTLEEGGLSLEESMKIFEEGMKWVRQCEARLKEAQKKVEILIRNRSGEKVVRDFEETENE